MWAIGSSYMWKKCQEPFQGDYDMTRRRISTLSAFTLVELLVVIAIIGVLVALLLPAVQAAREAARRTQCVNQVRQVVLAAHLFENSKGRFPTAVDEWGYSYLVQLLPYHEEKSLHDLVNLDLKWDDPVNRVAYETPLPVFKCPSTPWVEPTQTVSTGLYSGGESPLRAHYAAVLGAKNSCPSPEGDPYTVTSQPYGCGTGGRATNGVMYLVSQTRFKDITDGASQTLLIGEFSGRVGLVRTWMVGSADPPSNDWVYSGKNVFHPINSAARDDPGVSNSDVSFSSLHPGGAHFGMADGGGRFIGEDIELRLYKALASRNAEDLADETP
jgi:prepilin-type N-terminal cleavage/methylation domain-containing protein